MADISRSRNSDRREEERESANISEPENDREIKDLDGTAVE